MMVKLSTFVLLALGYVRRANTCTDVLIALAAHSRPLKIMISGGNFVAATKIRHTASSG